MLPYGSFELIQVSWSLDMPSCFENNVTEAMFLASLFTVACSS